jgi:hypothetical protein
MVHAKIILKVCLELLYGRPLDESPRLRHLLYGGVYFGFDFLVLTNKVYHRDFGHTTVFCVASKIGIISVITNL